ncbi:MAG: DUF6880 family protein [Cyanobium sp.]
MAATLCLRALIDFSLKLGREKRYAHAARHLATRHRPIPLSGAAWRAGPLSRRPPRCAPPANPAPRGRMPR